MRSPWLVHTMDICGTRPQSEARRCTDRQSGHWLRACPRNMEGQQHIAIDLVPAVFADHVQAFLPDRR
jgi:hypothetical protein